MLIELSGENFGIVEDIKWRPTSGLNILTGETGAGKSLIIDIIEVLAGKRVGEEVIRAGKDHCSIEGVFQLDDASPLKELLTEQGLEAEETIILSREIGREGHTFNRVNGHSVPLRFLREIGGALIDIHGQSDHVSLNDTSRQLLLLDRYASVKNLRSEVESRAERLYRLERELKALREDEREIARRIDLLDFQTVEIRKAEIHQDEDEELQRESAVLSNVEKLRSLSQAACQALSGDDVSLSSALDKTGEAVCLLKELAQLDDSLADLLGELESALYQIEDTSHTLRAYLDKLGYDPARLEQVEQRLDIIRNLKRKYGDTIAAIIQYADKAEAELKHLNFQSENRAQLEEECASLKKEIGTLSYELSEIRRRAAGELTGEIEEELSHLNMAQVGFHIRFSRPETGEEVILPDGDSCAFSKSGIDKVEFQVSTNPGEPFKPLAKIASTGETSRLMLAIKSTLSRADTTPTLIFDEIDIGIGGRSGEVVGKKLSNLSREHQVICITHLPQVAAFADSHYSVRKDVSDGRTITTVSPLPPEARTEEISAMAGSLSEPAMESAQELLKKAADWKKS
ncbi:MAG: DNA repair protein RecN [Dehalococcoidia bacterium]|nr:DNA repair protein RecN [Dehalococcoidia bacterium]